MSSHRTASRAPRAVLVQFACLLSLCTSARADDLDDLVKAQMREHKIPGLSLAIVSKGAIVREQGYGSTGNAGQPDVTPDTLFQAASISKAVAAAGALRLVESGKLQLDANVNRTLRGWQVPDNAFTADSKVTLRGILSNSSGLGTPSFPGYAAGVPLPTLDQVLDGTAPANTGGVRVEYAPRSQWRYSGGGHVVLQKLMVDATGKPFAPLMHELVLAPLGMRHSSFAQPLPASMAAAAATGHTDGAPLPGRWHAYPEQAAAGLWTTASDLARFAIGLQDAFRGQAGAILSQTTAKEMMSRQIRSEGLGLFVMGVDNRAPSLWYGGRNRGFDAFLWFAPASGDGIVIMINANDDADASKRIATSIAATYQMTGFPFH